MRPQSPAGEPTTPEESLTLDFDAALAEAAGRPLPFPDASFDRIAAGTAFTKLVDAWAEWLLELRRLVADDGQLVVGLSAPASFESLTGGSWDEARLGMTVLAAPDEPGGRQVFHSEWWLRAHWGRAFDVVSIDQADGGRYIVLGKRPGAVAADDLRRPEPGEERELAAAQANVSYLGAQLERTERQHRREMERQRDEMSRELMRRSFEAVQALRRRW
jgi:SAM-dependent methyltransferase